MRIDSLGMLLAVADHRGPSRRRGQGPAPRTKAQENAATKKWTPPRTPWGEPDLQGIWDFATITPPRAAQ